ncbi:MAG: class I SAM-dependent methyltransferase [Gammaproteobacteria bacterium]
MSALELHAPRLIAMATPKHAARCTWEEAVEILRSDPAHQERIYDSYLTADLLGNCERFFRGAEFREVASMVQSHCVHARRILDMPGGNGIATYAFARSGFDVTTVEPDPSDTVGHGAIARVLAGRGVRADVVAAVGEKLPFRAASFDVVYVRQGLHHARDLLGMTMEIARVLRPSGVLLACREHVVDNYRGSLEAFLESQPDHQLYGGEHAFTLKDYRGAIVSAGLRMALELGPFDSIVNMFPNDHATLRRRILLTTPGRVLGLLLSADRVATIGMGLLRRRRTPGRLYSFIARKGE